METGGFCQKRGSGKRKKSSLNKGVSLDVHLDSGKKRRVISSVSHFNSESVYNLFHDFVEEYAGWIDCCNISFKISQIGATNIRPISSVFPTQLGSFKTYKMGPTGVITPVDGLING